MEPLFGRDLFGREIKPTAAGVVAERFTSSPFTVLDARSGEWQKRKRAWASLGIRGEEGRVTSGANALSEGVFRDACQSEARQKIMAAGGAIAFDPTLCELAYLWWSPPGGQVVDPFAGGSVRGIVAGALGRRYWGGELRPEQVEANRRQAGEIRPHVSPVWECGDSRSTLFNAPEADFVFSCPPYGDLEVYSDRPGDLSAMTWPAFLDAYREIVAASVARMRRDRFACFVVGDVRDDRGVYRNFVSETISAFSDAGADLYNEAILVTAVGSASMRVSRQFAASRKLCKTHQNVLVFVKGDPARASRACGDL